MEFIAHDMADVLAKREQRLRQLKGRADRLRHNADRSLRYLRLFGHCVGYNRRHTIREHLDDLLQAHKEAVADYEAAKNAPLATFA